MRSCIICKDSWRTLNLGILNPGILMPSRMCVSCGNIEHSNPLKLNLIERVSSTFSTFCWRWWRGKKRHLSSKRSRGNFKVTRKQCTENLKTFISPQKSMLRWVDLGSLTNGYSSKIWGKETHFVEKLWPIAMWSSQSKQFELWGSISSFLSCYFRTNRHFVVIYIHQESTL